MNVWIVNPFDELPNETDVPLRYWSLCKTFVQLEHNVIWWSSDFSHLRKAKREPCPEIDGFSVRLIETSPYSNNISCARLRNHRKFARNFYVEASATINNGTLEAPDRIVVSLPPLVIAQSAFRIRQLVQSKFKKNCQVTVDIMDAWPETFYRILPKPLSNRLGPLLFTSFHRSAKSAYTGADKISAVGQSYLNLAKSYLDTKDSNSEQTDSPKPMHPCYHGADLERFKSYDENQKSKDASKQSLPLKAVYIGSMSRGYDLMTLIEVAAKWQAEDNFAWQIHFAGTGPMIGKLQKKSTKLGLSTEFRKTKNDSLTNAHKMTDRVVFHGLLRKKAMDALLLSADLGLVPNRPDSRVACPYKAGEYAAAGLPMITCLRGELANLLKTWDAGCEYEQDNPGNLRSILDQYSTDPNLLKRQSKNAGKLAGALFDRSKTYPSLAKFIIDGVSS